MNKSKKALIEESLLSEEERSQHRYRYLQLFILCILGVSYLYFSMSYLIGINVARFSKKSFATDQAPHQEDHEFVPDQIHLSLGVNYTELYATWSTHHLVDKSMLTYCQVDDCEATKQTRLAYVHSTKFSKRTMHSYRAKIRELKANAFYTYDVATEKDGQMYRSKTYRFYVKDISSPLTSVNLALYGDLGLVNGQSVPRLIRDVDEGRYDAIIHNGDFAYDLDSHNGRVGDDFMRLIEPIAAKVPYQTSIGNHEAAENFTHYDHRFTMINSGGINNGEANNFYYSFNMGPIHFVAFSTEFYYFLHESGSIPLNKQYRWLKQDLKFASSPEQRALRPWIITFGHRPMYCSSRDRDDCTNKNNVIRTGLPFTGSYALEKLFYRYGVDVELYSHEHQYERFLPLYDENVYNGTDDPTNPYRNPLAPVHIISGSAGCQEDLDPFQNRSATGSIVKISDYGYTRLQANRCSLNFEQVSDDNEGQVVDKFVITKTRQNFPPSKSGIELDC